MKKILNSIIILLLAHNNFAQAPTIQWQKCLGGSGDELPRSMLQTRDGGYIVASTASSNNGDVSGNHGSNDIWITKLSNTNSIEWQKCLGGQYAERPDFIKQTTDGYIVAGTTTSSNGDISGFHGISANNGYTDIWIIKLNTTGSIQWQKCLGGTFNEVVNSIQQTSDGGYIISGQTESNDGDVSGKHGTAYRSKDIWVVKLSNTGSIQWQKCLGGSDYEDNSIILQTMDGGYIVVGNTESKDGDVSGYHTNNTSLSTDIWIVKLNGSGSIQWQKCLGGNNQDRSSSILQALDGGYVLTGTTLSSDGDVSGQHGSYDYWVVKLNNTGSIQWQKCLGGTLNEDIRSQNSLIQSDDGGYIIFGETVSSDGDVSVNHGFSDIWIVKLSNTGSLQWQKCLGGPLYEHMGFNTQPMQQTIDGGCIIAGITGSSDGDVLGNHGSDDIWIIKLNKTGSIQWQKSLGGTKAEDLYLSIQQTTDGGYIVVGRTQSNDGDVSGFHGSFDIWVVKLAPDITTGIEEKEINKTINIFPNPAQTQLHLSEKLKAIEIYDINGKLLMIEKESDILNVKDLNSGIYLLKGTTIEGDYVNAKFIKK